jgi:hypothetical protein
VTYFSIANVSHHRSYNFLISSDEWEWNEAFISISWQISNQHFWLFIVEYQVCYVYDLVNSTFIHNFALHQCLMTYIFRTIVENGQMCHICYWIDRRYFPSQSTERPSIIYVHWYNLILLLLKSVTNRQIDKQKKKYYEFVPTMATINIHDNFLIAYEYSSRCSIMICYHLI